jgi:transposase
MLTHLSLTLNEKQPHGRLNVGIDMGKRRWVADVLDTATGRHHSHNFTGTDCAASARNLVQRLVKTGREVDVIYEAGRNGFTPARELTALGAAVTVLPVNKLEVVKAGKAAKTDRLDAHTLSERDARAVGFPRVWVPPVEDECRRRMIRERERLQEDIKRNNNRILSILELWPAGYTGGHRPAATWNAHLQNWRRTGAVPKELPENEYNAIAAMVRELETLEKNLAAWERQMDKELKRQRQEAQKSGTYCTVDILQQYKGIGQEMATALCWIVGDFSRFSNGKKFSSLLGLVPMPWDSGKMRKCQGISKAGPADLRRLMVEMAWLWVRYQPDSVITRKWQPKLAEKGRSRKKAIVAVARQLAVAILRLLNEGIEIEGAVKNLPLVPPPARLGSPMHQNGRFGD